MPKRRSRCRRPTLKRREANALSRLAALAGAVLALSAMLAPTSGQDGPGEDSPKQGAPLAVGRTDADFELTVEVGGAPMAPSRNILENAALSKDLTRFIADAEATGLGQTLTGAGPFTLFAPVNKAFQNLPKDLSDRLIEPENARILNQILSYHLLRGKYSAAEFIAAIKAGGGKATFKTLEGDELSLRQDGRRLEILDSQGGRAIVTISDVNQKNGVMHVIDAVLLPKG